MITIDEIHALKTRYVDLYGDVRQEQEADQQFIDDTFPVPEVRKPHKPLRTGMGYYVVNAPAEQIVTSNPQAFFEVFKGNKDSAIRFSAEVNQNWFRILANQNPNPFKEFVKNELGRGESYIWVSHNENWVTGNKDRYGLPVHFLIPDPMVIYASPEEDENGIPERVIIFYKRQLTDLIMRYPDWSNPKKVKEGKTVEWLGYFDKDVRYFEADGEPVLKGEIQKNIYGITPFVRRYSGFGRRSPEGKLSELIVSDLRHTRGLIQESCAMRSDISSVLHIFAHKPINIIVPPGAEIDENALKNNIDLGSYGVNLLQLPEGSKFQEYEHIEQPSAETYAHLADVERQITQRHPFIRAGYPFGSSGRQQDMSYVAGMKRYDTVVENTESAFATAVEIALKICEKVPTLKPEGLRKSDFNTKYFCKVALRAKDPIEEDRKITLGDRLWAQGNGSIDLRTYLTEFQGRTQAEAEDIIANLLVDKLTIYNPDVAEVMGMVFAEESGMKDWIAKAKQRRMELGNQQGALQQTAPPTTQQRIQGEVQTPIGMEMGIAGGRGARQAPGRYTRGGM